MSSARPALTVDRDMAPSCSLLGATLAALFSRRMEMVGAVCPPQLLLAGTVFKF